MKAIICIGVSGSGKSTWGEEHRLSRNNGTSERWVIICRDEIRKDILRKKGINPDLPGHFWGNWNWKWEKQVNEQYDLIIQNHLDCNLILADTNLNPKYRDALLDKLRNLGYDIEIKEFPISFEEAVKRDLGRLNSVGSNVIWKQYLQWLEYKGEPRHVHQEGLPAALICDLDGTLAIHNGRSPYNWNRVGEDLVNSILAEALETFYWYRKVLLVSGRDSICREATQKWLEDNDIAYDKLWMRDQGDSRSDAIVKKEIFFKYIDGKYNVELVIDDRPIMTRSWRSLGLKVWQVADPLVEF